MALSKIEWTDYTNNAWDGCTNVAPECDNCYAEARNARFSGGEPANFGAGKPRKRHEPATRNAPRRWNREPFYQCDRCAWRGPEKKTGTVGDYRTMCCPACQHIFLSKVRPRVFAQSLSDTFDNEVKQEWRDELFALMEECTNLDWLVLTKRIGNVRKMVPTRWLEPGGWPKHIRLGVTAGTQKAADRDIPQLLALPCPNFVSMEPLLERVSIAAYMPHHYISANGDDYHGQDEPCATCGVKTNALHWVAAARGIEWVIVGGESGRGEGIRPMLRAWAQLLRDQCEAAGVPFLFKQWGEWTPGENVNLVAGRVRVAWYYNNEWTFGTENMARTDGHKDDEPDVYRIGKDRAGRKLDGRTWDGFPVQQAA